MSQNKFTKTVNENEENCIWVNDTFVDRREYFISFFFKWKKEKNYSLKLYFQNIFCFLLFLFFFIIKKKDRKMESFFFFFCYSFYLFFYTFLWTRIFAILLFLYEFIFSFFLINFFIFFSFSIFFPLYFSTILFIFFNIVFSFQLQQVEEKFHGWLFFSQVVCSFTMAQ